MKGTASWIYASIAGLFAFLVALLVLRPWLGAAGYDVYYYALQTRSLELSGMQLFSDRSPVYGALVALNLIVGDPLLNTQIFASLCFAVIAAGLMRIAVVKGGGVYRVSLAIIAVCNPASFYLLLEFTKNIFALALMISGIAVLQETRRPPSLEAFRHADRRTKVKIIIGASLLLLGALSHRLMLVIVLLIIGLELLLPRAHDLLEKAKPVVVLSALAVAFVLIVVGILMAPDRIPLFSASAPADRIINLWSGQLLTSEKLLYLGVQIGVPIAGSIYLYRQFRRKQWHGVSYGCLSWLLLFPFLDFTWDGTGFRLLILSPLFLAMWLLMGDHPQPRRGTLLAAGVLLLSLFFLSEGVRHLRIMKGPDYARYDEVFADLPSSVRGFKVVAHRGLAGYLWLEQGIWTENFMPPNERSAEYLRLVYAFSPSILERYIPEQIEDPLITQISPSYTLVSEELWQEFYRRRRDLQFLRSERNPWLPRPRSAFRINQEAARSMSPVTFPNQP